MPRTKSIPKRNAGTTAQADSKDPRGDDSGSMTGDGATGVDDSPQASSSTTAVATKGGCRTECSEEVEGDAATFGEQDVDLPLPRSKKQKQAVYRSEGTTAEEIARQYCTEDDDLGNMGYRAHCQFTTAARLHAVRTGRFRIEPKEGTQRRLLVTYTDAGRRDRSEEVPSYDEGTLVDVMRCAISSSTTSRRRKFLTPAKCAFLFNPEKIAQRSPPLFWSLVQLKLPIDDGIDVALEGVLEKAISSLQQ